MKTILSCEFKLECNRFLGTVTTKSDFEKRICLFGEDKIRSYYKGAKVEIPSFLDTIDPLPDYEIHPVFALNAQPGSPVSKEVYDLAESTMLKAMKSPTPLLKQRLPSVKTVSCRKARKVWKRQLRMKQSRRN